MIEEKTHHTLQNMIVPQNEQQEKKDEQGFASALHVRFRHVLVFEIFRLRSFPFIRY
jgi:hypothetical protein